MPRPKPENRRNELLYEGTISRADLAWLLFGDPQVMYAEAAGYRDEMGVKTPGDQKMVAGLIERYKTRNYRVFKIFMDYMTRRDPHLPSELAQDMNGRKSEILLDSLSVRPLMFYYDGMTFAIREDGTASVKGADQPNEMRVVPDTESDQNTRINTVRAEGDLQIVADSILMKLLANKVTDLLRVTRKKVFPTLKTTRIIPKSYQGLESVNKDLQAKGLEGDGLYRRWIIDIETEE